MRNCRVLADAKAFGDLFVGGTTDKQHAELYLAATERQGREASYQPNSLRDLVVALFPEAADHIRDNASNHPDKPRACLFMVRLSGMKGTAVPP